MGKPNEIFIRRCAWHKKYFGKKKIMSVEYIGHPEGTDNSNKDIDSSNTKITVSDVCCEECAGVWLEERK